MAQFTEMTNHGRETKTQLDEATADLICLGDSRTRERLRSSQSLDSSTRTRRNSGPSTLITFHGNQRAGISSLIHRIAYDCWKKSDTAYASTAEPPYFMIDERISVVLEDAGKLESTYTAMRNTIKRNAALRVCVFGMDSVSLATDVTMELHRISDEQELDTSGRPKPAVPPTLFVFTKNDLPTSERDFMICSRLITPCSGVLVPKNLDDVIIPSLSYLDCSSLTGDNVGDIRKFITHVALTAYQRTMRLDMSPRYSLAPHKSSLLSSSSQPARAAKVMSFPSNRSSTSANGGSCITM